nr:MAG: glutamyl-tRNA reductase [Bacteroidota bacterium]
MELFLLGLHHRRAPVEVRETFALPVQGRARFYAAILDGRTEAVLLSTCNRVELYLWGTEATKQGLLARLSELAGAPWPEGYAFELSGLDVARHLFRVAAGLDSQVLADEQILAQLKEAYREAVAAEAVGTVLHRLFHEAFRAGKRVRGETNLYRGSTSVAAVAVEHLERSLTRPLQEASVAVVGAGRMARAALGALLDRGARPVVLNRTLPRARELAQAFGLEAGPLEALSGMLPGLDAVLVATAAPEPILRPEHLPALAGPVWLLDLAVPRNVDPACARVSGYHLLDVDDLAPVLDRAHRARLEAVPSAERIVQEHVDAFAEWWRQRRVLEPFLEVLVRTFEALRIQHLERYRDQFPPEAQEALDRLTRSLLQKLLSIPLVRVKDLLDRYPEDLLERVALLVALFERPNCEESAPQPQPRSARSEVVDG